MLSVEDRNIMFFVVFSLLQVVLLRATAATFRGGDVRLVGGSYQWEGRLETFFAGSWGTITDSDWTSEDAQAVCRTMGYFRPGASPFTGAYFGQGSGPIHYDHIVCSGMEYNLTDCETGTGTRQSSHDEDVGVKCNTIDDNYRNGDIRLVGGPHNWEGRVEIFWNGTWGTISDADWGMSEAQVVCKQLQLPSEGAVPYRCCSQYGQGVGAVHITSINCSGSELNITQCFFSKVPPATHQSDVGVRCGEGSDFKSGDIRLVGGPLSWEGRVEIYLDGEWGTISNDQAEDEDAHVACRQLGYDIRYQYFDKSYGYDLTYFGEGSGAVHLNRLECSGNEYRLVDCGSSRTGREHRYDWSISCKNDAPEQGEVLLIYSFYDIAEYQGLLLVWFNSQWGTVSDDSWTIEDANAVCHQLGRSGVSPYSYNDYYGLEGFPVVISNVSCEGNELKLIDCPYTTGGSGSAVSLECSYSDPCSYGDTRLTGGSTELEGRVEMCNPRSMWGTVCGNQWTEANSRVVCSSLGYSVEEGTYQVSSTFKKTPTVPIAVDFVKCRGSENLLKDCVHFSHSYSECGHSDDVGVRCQADDCIDGDVRLFEYLGINDYEKRQYVLVCINKRWGPICSNNRQGNSKTLCNQFGYNGGYGGEGLISMPVQNITLQCSGDESRISDCPFDNSIPSSCYSHISIDCKNAYCTDGQVRLVDGATDVEGRVEICFSRRWGTISGDGWTQAESTVVCNDLGYEATDKDYSLRPAPNSMPVLLKGVRCTGKELSLLECGYRRAPIVLNHVKDVAVRCKSECDDGDLRLAGGDSENDGLLQVCFSGRWGTVNRDGWTDVDTHVACRQLGFNNTGTYSTKTATRRSISTPIQMDNVGCYGTEARLIDCAYDMETIIDYTDDYSEDYASEDTHYGDVWIDCSSSTSTTSGPDGCKGNTDCSKTPGDEIDSSNTSTSGPDGCKGNTDCSKTPGDENDSGVNNAKSKDKSSSEADSDEGNDVALILAVVAFVGFVLVSTVIISFIVYFIWKKGGARQSMRVHYLKSDQSPDETKMIAADDP